MHLFSSRENFTYAAMMKMIASHDDSDSLSSESIRLELERTYAFDLLGRFCSASLPKGRADVAANPQATHIVSSLVVNDRVEPKTNTHDTPESIGDEEPEDSSDDEKKQEKTGSDPYKESLKSAETALRR